MDPQSLAGLDKLTSIGLRGGVDMRPTLIRVLTDLYMQKLQHSADEEHHYTELALRLLERVDAQTRATIAAKLARHLSPPLRVIQRLVNDLPEVAAPLRDHPVLRQAKPASSPSPSQVLPEVIATEPPASSPKPLPSLAAKALDVATAVELNDLFLAADEVERRLILLNLDVVAPLPEGRVAFPIDGTVGHKLEAAALSRNREEFARHLAQALQIPREQARRLARDGLGEPMAVAARALGITREIVYRILMFANPAVGHSVERVHALAKLYDELTVEAAHSMVVIWQSLPEEESPLGKHRPLYAENDGRWRGRAAEPKQQAPALEARNRREAR